MDINAKTQKHIKTEECLNNTFFNIKTAEDSSAAFLCLLRTNY